MSWDDVSLGSCEIGCSLTRSLWGVPPGMCPAVRLAAPGSSPLTGKMLLVLLLIAPWLPSEPEADGSGAHFSFGSTAPAICPQRWEKGCVKGWTRTAAPALQFLSKSRMQGEEHLASTVIKISFLKRRRPPIIIMSRSSIHVCVSMKKSRCSLLHE